MKEITHYGLCRSKECQAHIFWALNLSTKKVMPVDAEPVPNGNVVLIYGGDFPAIKVCGDSDEIPADAARYVSHFATCVEVARWLARGLT